MRLKSQFLGQSYTARSLNLASDRLINLYAEMAPEGKDIGAFFGTPGLRQVLDTGNAGPIRGMCSFFNVTLLFVSGETLYYVDALTDTPAALGTIAGAGRVSMVPNQEDKVFIVAGTNAYIYNFITSTLTQVAPGIISAVPGGTCDFLASYFIFEERSTSTWYIWDGVTFDPLDNGVAEGTPDHLIAVLADHNEAWLFGDLSTEVWASSGDPDFPFERIPGALIPQGCVAKFTPVRLDNSVFWLGRNEFGYGVVWRANGYTPARVSTHAVELAIQSYGDISDAFAFGYQQEGHAFYQITFPSANATWVYDAATNLWHERASRDPETGGLGRHRANCATFFQNEIVVGDWRTGKLFVYDLASYTDGSYGPVTGFTPDMNEVSETDNQQLAAAKTLVNGTGYNTLDILTLEGGTFTRPAQMMMVGPGTGVALGVLAVIDAGDYTVLPSNPCTVSGGTGSGAEVNAYWTSADQVIISRFSGRGYTASPTITVDDTYGVGATATAVLQCVGIAPFIAGTGYLVGETLTATTGTFSQAAQFRVEAINGSGGVTAASLQVLGSYTVATAGANPLTGGSGSGATASLFFGLGLVTLVSGGTEYSAVPTVTVTGAGTGAAITAVLDATVNYIKSLRAFRALPQGQNQLNRTFQHTLVLDGQAGVGLDGIAQGDNPQVMLRWSDDGGHTWSNEHWRSLGRIGVTGHRTYWRRLGSTEKLRDRVYEVSITDPVKRALIDAYIDVSPGAS